MGLHLGRAILLLIAVACGPKKSPDPVTPPDGDGGGGGGGEPQAKCDPGRCLEDISALIMADRKKARECFDAAAKTKPDIEGRVIINFEIDPEGTVVDASQGMQDNQLTEAEVVDCISAWVRTLKFAKSPSGKTTRAYHRFDFVKK